MPVNLSIQHAPDKVVDRLRSRAARNHRSLQGELLAIIEKAAMKPPGVDVFAVFEQVRALGIKTPSDGVEIIRADRDRNFLADR